MRDWGALIRQALTDCDVSERRLAQEANVNRSTLWRFLQGKTSPSIDALERILACLDYEIDVMRASPPEAKPEPEPVPEPSHRPYRVRIIRIRSRKAA